MDQQDFRETDGVWVVEREEAIMLLRQLCDAFGDNDWQEELWLADILEKHLWSHLEQA